MAGIVGSLSYLGPSQLPQICVLNVGSTCVLLLFGRLGRWGKTLSFSITGWLGKCEKKMRAEVSKLSLLGAR